ncbi:hypothetical protein [Thalassospira xiamenensis]|uniref:Alpha/beta hydrolase family protein n=1 Tax=Thalassospira xiamenensis TaxID=220697 RepID=A0A285TUX7_9PROT|nr:hypothetical protein [Thalassospira xiamenensis]SOC27322.1 hypothetical protein SAMN05428964_105379 [Thalassospira xiamenensis]
MQRKLWTRRDFVNALLVAGTASVWANKALASDVIIKNPNPDINQGDLYSRLANAGEWGYPSKPVLIKLDSDLVVFAYLPPTVRNARVVVFSHAELSVPSVYSPLLNHWASQGYAVLAPIHEDSLLDGGTDSIARGTLNEIWAPSAAITDIGIWNRRIRQCERVLEFIPVLNKTWGTDLDITRPIIAGHSWGAFVAQILTGARAVTYSGEVLERPSSGFSSGILLSPFGRGVLGLVDGSWQSALKPTIVVTGNGEKGQEPSIRSEAFTLAPAGNRHLAWFKAITEGLVSGDDTRQGKVSEHIFLDVLAVTTAFLDAYARYDEEVFAALAGQYFTKATRQRVTAYYR